MNKMKYSIKVVVDTNDADCNTTITTITDKQLTKLEPLFKAINSFKPYEGKKDGSEFTHTHNFPYGECCREDLGEKTPEEIYAEINSKTLAFFIDECCPCSEFGFHTIKSIEISPIIEWTKIV